MAIIDTPTPSDPVKLELLARKRAGATLREHMVEREMRRLRAQEKIR